MSRFDEANKIVFEKMNLVESILIDIKPAVKVIPEMDESTILHAGPPIVWERMCGPMRGAVIGALIYEGHANTMEKAERMASSGGVKFSPCHHHNAVGPMAGIISPSMPVFIIRNKKGGNLAYSTINEGLGRALRFGAYSEDVIERLKWIERDLAPTLKAALGKSKGVDVKNIMSQAVHMGDECHNRNIAGTSLFLIEIMSLMLEAGLNRATTLEAIKFIDGNKQFFLNLSMAACKATMDAVHKTKDSSIVTAMARNGVEFGIRVSALGDRWFTAPSLMPKGLFFPGYSEEDANPDLGDSTITETFGIGGFAMAAAPAIVRFVGGSPSDAVNFVKEMDEITVGKNRSFTMPILNFEGTPTGIDILKVVKTGITPIINTGMAHKKAGVGQVGAGIVRAPLDCFKKSLQALAEDFNI